MLTRKAAMLIAEVCLHFHGRQILVNIKIYNIHKSTKALEIGIPNTLKTSDPKHFNHG